MLYWMQNSLDRSLLIGEESIQYSLAQFLLGHTNTRAGDQPALQCPQSRKNLEQVASVKSCQNTLACLVKINWFLLCLQAEKNVLIVTNHLSTLTTFHVHEMHTVHTSGAPYSSSMITVKQWKVWNKLLTDVQMASHRTNVRRKCNAIREKLRKQFSSQVTS